MWLAFSNDTPTLTQKYTRIYLHGLHTHKKRPFPHYHCNKKITLLKYVAQSQKVSQFLSIPGWYFLAFESNRKANLIHPSSLRLGRTLYLWLWKQSGVRLFELCLITHVLPSTTSELSLNVLWTAPKKRKLSCRDVLLICMENKNGRGLCFYFQERQTILLVSK